MNIPVDNLMMLGENPMTADEPVITEAAQIEMANLIHAWVAFIQVHSAVKRSLCPEHFQTYNVAEICSLTDPSLNGFPPDFSICWKPITSPRYEQCSNHTILVDLRLNAAKCLNIGVPVISLYAYLLGVIKMKSEIFYKVQ
ncbi:hypothetical protein FRX31_025764 [Thalictrum thalictroides]|uniref:Uncharacterized protein n=1 Tax=Thalictrum thalictroides TaxID=46969 RepID=A0A7J6VHR7_THATH|nr:hypothetical protein FRX31_025764 [Thalictrum thalictroides]